MESLPGTRRAAQKRSALEACLYSDEVLDANDECFGDGSLKRTVDEFGVVRWYWHGLLGRPFGLHAVEHVDGTREWYVDGLPGRRDDLPTREYAYGVQVWYRPDGTIGRDGDRPGRLLRPPLRCACFARLPLWLRAAVVAPGSKTWYLDGKIGRAQDLPARVDADASFWYLDGELGRLNGMHAVQRRDGTKEWYRDGLLHRDGDQPGERVGLPVLFFCRGPLAYPCASRLALECADGRHVWYQHGKIFRAGDRPACVTATGERQWFLNGQIGRANDLPGGSRGFALG
jgi:hypothetical protein